MNETSNYEALRWLRLRGGSWRREPLKAGSRLFAGIGSVEACAVANDNSEPGLRQALTAAIEDLRRTLG